MDDLVRIEVKSKSFPVETFVDLNQDREVELTSNGESDGKNELPFSRIILSAHICLLLHEVIKPCAIIQQKCAKLLPRTSFWLPIRVLKAFITLQGKTGLCATDSVQDSIVALRAFEKYEMHTLGDSASVNVGQMPYKSPHQLVR